MKPKTAGWLSGCIVWLIVFSMLMSAILPITIAIGAFTSFTDFAMQTVKPVICPEGTTARSYSYPTTTTDEYGNSEPSTAYELHCLDANGAVVKSDPILFVLVWTGSIALIGLVIGAVLALAAALPAGLFIKRIVRSKQKQDLSINIEPY